MRQCRKRKGLKNKKNCKFNRLYYRNNLIKGNDTNVQKSIEFQKQLYELIPKEKDEIFKYTINWNTLFQFDILDNKIKPWLSKKTREYLSEEEPSLIALLLKMITNKCTPYEIMEKIKVIFEEDTEV